MYLALTKKKKSISIYTFNILEHIYIQVTFPNSMQIQSASPPQTPNKIVLKFCLFGRGVQYDFIRK